jgi:hypothetical protein
MPNTVPDPNTVRDTVPTPLVSFPVRTPRELRAALANRNLSQLRLAALTGCDPRTVRRWVDTRAPFGDRQLARPIQALIHISLSLYDQDHATDPIQPDQPGEQSSGSNDPAACPPPPVPSPDQ